MDVVDDFKTEIENLKPTDRRWIFTCLVVAIAALFYALLVGNIIGNILGFVLAVSAGWVMRWQWQVVTEPTGSVRPRRASAKTSMPEDGAISTESMAARWRRRAFVSLGFADEPAPDETLTASGPAPAIADLPQEPINGHTQA